MTGMTDTERILSAFLAPDGDRLPDRVIDATLEVIAGTTQVPGRRRWALTSSRQTSFLAFVAAVLAIAVGLLGISVIKPPVGPAPTTRLGPTVGSSPSPSAQPTSGSSPSPVPLPAELQGVWQATDEPHELTVRATTMFVGAPACADCWVFNATVDGNIIHFFGIANISAASICYPSGTTSAKYHWSISDGTLTFTSIQEDPCSWRSDWLDSHPFKRIPNATP